MSKTIKVVVAFAGFILLGLLVWGVLIEPRMIDAEHQRVVLSGLPVEWEGKRIALIADLQIGMWFDNEGTVRRIVDLLVSEQPAAVLIGGDFIYNPTEEDSKREAREEYDPEEQSETRQLIENVVGILRPLIDSELPVYAVLGNHDYAMETQRALKLEWVAEELAAALQTAGIEVLQNEWVELRGQAVAAEPDRPPLYLVGIGAYYPGEADAAKAFAGLAAGDARIVMTHNPQPFGEIPAGEAPLAMAGHTHGGQIQIPFLPSWSWISIVEKGQVHADGWIRNFGQSGNRLYVNRGIGFSTVPIRINCMPEVTFFTLVSN